MGDFAAKESFPRIRNRLGLEIFVKVLEVAEPRGNAYLVHGLGDVHDAAILRALTRGFIDSGFNVIVWDATHSKGRSEGETAQASFYFHHHDLEDVIEWSKGQDWYRPDYILAGHSLGGMAAGTFAAAHPLQVKGLVLVAPVVSGPALRRRLPGPFRMWWRLRGQVRPRLLGRNAFGWEFVRSSWAYNLIASANRLTMPVMIIGASKDLLIPARILRRLYRAIKHDHKRIEIIEGARHNFNTAWEMERLTYLVKDWVTQELDTEAKQA